MGQSECLKILKKNKWLSTTDVSVKLNQSRSVVTSSLKRLYKYGEIERKSEVKGQVQCLFFWKLKND